MREKVIGQSSQPERLPVPTPKRQARRSGRAPSRRMAKDACRDHMPDWTGDGARDLAREPWLKARRFPGRHAPRRLILTSRQPSRCSACGRLAKEESFLSSTSVKHIFAVAALLALLLPAGADELPIARFDAQRVFDQYQHTKDIQRKIDEKRSVGGPGSYTPSIDRRDKLKTRSDKLTEALKTAPAGSPERERIELQLQMAALELELDEVRAAVAGAHRDRSLQDESMRQHAELVGEIRSAALRLGKERGYRLVVPDNLPSGLGLYLPILVSGAGEDLTEALLARLNEEYAANKSK